MSGVSVPPYAAVGQRLIERGFSAIPIVPGEKRPGEFKGGEWRGMYQWDRFCDRMPSHFEIDIWSGWLDAGVCVALGKISNLTAIDFDYGSDSVRAALEAILPPSPVRKTGKKGYTAFYQGYALESRKFIVAKQSVIEVLAQGKQTVLPPTIHPDGMPYRWITQETLESMTAGELPTLPADLHEQIARTLSPFQTDEDRGSPAPRALQVTEGSYWREVNDRAMADFGVWVPQLFPHAKPSRMGTYRVIAHWRDCEKPNVSIHSEGITDWGLGENMTPIDLVMKATASDLEAATRWLKDRVGMPTLDALPIMAMKSMAQEKPAPAVEKIDGDGVTTEAPAPALPAERPTPPAPAGYFKIEGAVGMFVDHINKTSRRPQPVLAVGAVLCAIGALMGRKYRSPTNLRTNLYAISVADSGAGKNHAREEIDRVLREAGLSRYIGGNKIASGAALLTAALRQPAILFMQDEFGQFLSAITDRRRSPKHVVEIVDLLTELFTTAATTFRGTEYADQRERPRRDIINPCVCVYGTTTPQSLWPSLSSANAFDGSLARFLLFETDDSYPPAHMAENGPPPRELVDLLKRIASREGNVADVLAGDSQPPEPIVVPYTSDAGAQIGEFDDTCIQTLREAAGTKFSAVLARQFELTIKVALISAVGRNPEQPIIDVGDFEWARLVVQRSIDLMVGSIERFVADNETERRAKAILECIRKAGKHGISKTQLTVRNQYLKATEIDDVIKTLIQSEQITFDVVPGKTKPQTIYRAL